MYTKHLQEPRILDALRRRVAAAGGKAGRAGAWRRELGGGRAPPWEGFAKRRAGGLVGFTW